MEYVNKDVYSLAKSIITADIKISNYIKNHKTGIITHYNIDESTIDLNTTYPKLYNNITTLKKIMDANKDYFDVISINWNLNAENSTRFFTVVDILKKILVF